MGAPADRAPCLEGHPSGVGNRAWLSRKTKQPNNELTLRHQGLSLETPERLLRGGDLATKIREERDTHDQDGRGELEDEASRRCWCRGQEVVVFTVGPWETRGTRLSCRALAGTDHGPSLLNFSKWALAAERGKAHVQRCSKSENYSSWVDRFAKHRLRPGLHAQHCGNTIEVRIRCCGIDPEDLVWIGHLCEGGKPFHLPKNSPEAHATLPSPLVLLRACFTWPQPRTHTAVVSGSFEGSPQLFRLS